MEANAVTSPKRERTRAHTALSAAQEFASRVFGISRGADTSVLRKVLEGLTIPKTAEPVDKRLDGRAVRSDEVEIFLRQDPEEEARERAVVIDSMVDQLSTLMNRRAHRREEIAQRIETEDPMRLTIADVIGWHAELHTLSDHITALRQNIVSERALSKRLAERGGKP